MNKIAITSYSIILAVLESLRTNPDRHFVLLQGWDYCSHCGWEQTGTGACQHTMSEMAGSQKSIQLIQSRNQIYENWLVVRGQSIPARMFRTDLTELTVEAAEQFARIGPRWIIGEGDIADPGVVWGVAFVPETLELLFFDRGMSPDFDGNVDDRKYAGCTGFALVDEADVKTIEEELFTSAQDRLAEWPTVNKYLARSQPVAYGLSNPRFEV